MLYNREKYEERWKRKMFCKNCGAELTADTKFCPEMWKGGKQVIMQTKCIAQIAEKKCMTSIAQIAVRRLPKTVIAIMCII